MKRVLFVCTANLQRSPTAEDSFQGWKGIWEARSAGILPDPGCNQLSQEVVDWADVIVVMEPVHRQYIQANYQLATSKIHVLHIPDVFFRGDTKLKEKLLQQVPPILEKY